MKGLGRKIPTTWTHVERYRLAEIGLPVPPDGTEKSLGLPWWWKQSDQEETSACVGFGCSHMMSITNHKQRQLATGKDVSYRYDAPWLYAEARKVDEWPGEADDGTSVSAGCDILRERGHRRVQSGVSGPENLANGISANRWATTVDEIRAALYANLAVALGINWYSSFDDPFQKVPGGDYWISISSLALLRGGHCLCVYRMSDSRQAFRLMNSWNGYYPQVWISYDTVERLLGEYGEAVVIVDR